MLLSLVTCSFQEPSFLKTAPPLPIHMHHIFLLKSFFFLLDFQCTTHYNAFRKEGEGEGEGNQEEEKYQQGKNLPVILPPFKVLVYSSILFYKIFSFHD